MNSVSDHFRLVSLQISFPLMELVLPDGNHSDAPRCVCMLLLVILNAGKEVVSPPPRNLIPLLPAYHSAAFLLPSPGRHSRRLMLSPYFTDDRSSWTR